MLGIPGEIGFQPISLVEYRDGGKEGNVDPPPPNKLSSLGRPSNTLMGLCLLVCHTQCFSLQQITRSYVVSMHSWLPTFAILVFMVATFSRKSVNRDK